MKPNLPAPATQPRADSDIEETSRGDVAPRPPKPANFPAASDVLCAFAFLWATPRGDQ